MANDKPWHGRKDLDLREQQAWAWLRSLAGRGAEDGDPVSEDVSLSPPLGDGAWQLLHLYLPLCRDCPDRFVVAHLGQSLDGRIAAANGASQWVTGPEDVAHNHRMRALFDAVVVGAGTVAQR